MAAAKRREPVEVVLTESHGTTPQGAKCFFVVIRNVPHCKEGLIITDARPIEVAERIKLLVEQSLDAYRKPNPKAPKKGRTAWARIDRGVLDK